MISERFNGIDFNYNEFSDIFSVDSTGFEDGCVLKGALNARLWFLKGGLRSCGERVSMY